MDTIPVERVSLEYAAAVDAGDLDRLEDLLAEDVVDHHLPPGLPTGRAGVRAWIALLKEALDLRVEVLDVVAGTDRVAVRARITGQHVGDFEGLAATGRSFAAEYHSVERIVGGRIVERWEVADTAAITAQLTGGSAA